MRVLFALPGFHKVDRGAETALLAVANELALRGASVTVFGSGYARAGSAYDFRHVGAIPRTRFQRFPSLPALRNDTSYEDATFAFSLTAHFRPGQFDITVTSNFPHTSWMLRRPVLFRRRPRHIFVTQNGDWPALSNESEFKYFACDGLVCTNPEYYERNRYRWHSALIPNGVDRRRFCPGPSMRGRLNLPKDTEVILMVSALVESKRVMEGVEAAAGLPNSHLIIAGSGPLRDAVNERARLLMPGRFTQLTLPAEDMPALYNTADVLMHLSLEESFGNIFVEAMATGLPIVAHDSPRVRWIVGDDEHLVDSMDLPSVTAALAEALQAGRRPVHRIAAKTERFTWQSIGVSYHKFFSDLLPPADAETQ